jgi:multicomponent Na+:H+ antiporter subunit F
MDLMITYLIYFLVGSCVVSLVRVLRGPSIADRMVGLNLVAAQILALLVLVSLQEGRAVYLDVALVYDIFGFIGVLAITRYFAGRKRRA